MNKQDFTFIKSSKYEGGKGGTTGSPTGRNTPFGATPFGASKNTPAGT